MDAKQIAQFIDHTALTAEKRNKILFNYVMKPLHISFGQFVLILPTFR
ncbi:hypothetical protein AAUPMC_14075 [Pasteurella multocida subsp. multocida str. Anand1_cattle]|nr:hypothetical protein AAUPMC_14075 [Pasteurella multocida subsp. multocida str. Anand1_cattle]